MPYTSEIDVTGRSRFQGLFVGVHGSGKTVAAASWPGATLIYDFDGRVDPVASFYPKRKDIEYKVVGGKKVNRPDAITFRAFCEEMEALQDSCPYENVIIDSITSLTLTVVRYQLSFKGKFEEEGGTRKKGKVLAGGIIVPTWDEFNGECQTVCEIVEIAKVLDANIIFTAHPVAKMEIGSGEQGIKSESITAFGYKTPNFVPNYFNEIYNFSREDTDGVGLPPRRFVRTQAGQSVLCKTAIPQILPPRFEITNLPLYRVIEGFKLEYLKKQEQKNASTSAGPQAEANVGASGPQPV